jgi:hypothetical protein
VTANDFLNAIALKLKDLYPGKKVFVNQIPSGADGNFFVGTVETAHEKHLDRRRKRRIMFEILYFLKSDDALKFHDFEEKAFDGFESIAIDGRTVHLTNLSARRNGDMNAYQLRFDADFYFVYAPDPSDKIAEIERLEILKQ